MAKQTGIVGIVGTVGGMTFSKNGNISKAVGSRPVTSIRTAENNSEFKTATQAAKVFRDAFRQIAANVSDSKAHARAMKLMKLVLDTDAINDRGLRGVVDAEIELVNGFEFNPNAVLSSIMYGEFEAIINRATGAHKVMMPAFNPGRDLSAPTGATHFKFLAQAASIDFEAKVSETIMDESDYLLISGTNIPALELDLPLTLNSTHPIAVALGIEFYQDLSGKKYLLGNGAYTTASVIAVDGGV
jgi:hypothetical protein